jgi:sugar lactone lactonase YvrE
LLGLEPDGALAPVADLSSLGEGAANELVIDGSGNAYVNGGEGSVVRVTPDGSVSKVADGLEFPNGMALIDRDRTLIVADSYAQALTAYEVLGDGSLSAGRVWAEVEHAPDGICADTDDALWVATVPGRRCIRVSEGGEVLDTVAVDRGCFACMLGGEDRRTLFIAAAEWRGMDALAEHGPGLTGQLLAAPDQPAPHAGRP